MLVQKKLSNDGNFLDTMTKTSLPIATTLDYDMVNAMAEQKESSPEKDSIATTDIVNEATSSNLRGASEIQLQPIANNVDDGFLANESQVSAYPRGRQGTVYHTSYIREFLYYCSNSWLIVHTIYFNRATMIRTLI